MKKGILKCLCALSSHFLFLNSFWNFGFLPTYQLLMFPTFLTILKFCTDQRLLLISKSYRTFWNLLYVVFRFKKIQLSLYSTKWEISRRIKYQKCCIKFLCSSTMFWICSLNSPRIMGIEWGPLLITHLVYIKVWNHHHHNDHLGQLLSFKCLLHKMLLE